MGTGKKVPQVFIGDGVNSSTTTIEGIASGDLFLVTIGGTLITTTAAAQALSKEDYVQIAMGIDTGKALLSMPIRGSLVKSYIGNKYDAPVQEVTYVGFNGTSGTLPTDTDTHYRLRLVFKGANVLSTRGPWFSDSLIKTASTSSESAIAYKLVDAFANDYSEGSKYVKAERVSDGTKAAVGTGTVSFTFTKGSKAVICNGDIDDATGGAALAVGASLVIGASGDTDSLYIISTIDTTNDVLTLDTEYAGENATYLDTELTQVSAANTAAASYGIKLVGKEIDDLLPDYDQYKMTNFEVMFAEVGVEGTTDSAAIITYTTTPFPGNGYYRQVQAAEREAQTFRGWHSKTKYYHQKPTSYVDSTVGYDSVTIEFATEEVGDLGRPRYNPLVATTYIPTGTAQSDEDTANSFASILNGYFSTVCGFTAINLDS